jgi:hypothetical protein
METEKAAAAELRRALLEIEWASRTKATVATLTRINGIARAALRPDASHMGSASDRLQNGPTTESWAAVRT